MAEKKRKKRTLRDWLLGASEETSDKRPEFSIYEVKDKIKARKKRIRDMMPED